MSDMKVSSSVKEMTKTMTDLMDLLQSFSKSGADLTSRFISQMAQTLKLPKMDACCNIPPACWMPKGLGEVTSHVCPGGTATLRLCVTNCGLGTQTITAKGDPVATVDPASIQLRPMQRGCLTVSYTVPPSSNDCQPIEILVWLHGCKSYYLRWTVQTSHRGCECCHEIEVEDCPDLIHHWYDHFYCQRSCQPAWPTSRQ
jgi:hypothetical protein